MPGTEGGRGCPRPRGWSAAASAAADTETKALSGSRPVRPLPARPAGAPAGAGVAAAAGREGRQEKGRAAAPLSTRHRGPAGPGRPRRASFAAPPPCDPGGQSRGGRGRPPGQAGQVRKAARERRKPTDSAPPPPVPPPCRRALMASRRGAKALFYAGRRQRCLRRSCGNSGQTRPSPSSQRRSGALSAARGHHRARPAPPPRRRPRSRARHGAGSSGHRGDVGGAVATWLPWQPARPPGGGSGGRAGAAMAGTLLALLALLGGSQVLKAKNFSHWKGEQQMYKLDIGWPKAPEHFTGQTFCVAVDSLHGLVYVGQRGDNVPKVLVFSEEGYFLHSWNDTVEMPHGIFVWNTETGSSVWITDVGTGKYGHTVKQYSPLGKLMQVLGTPGNAGSSLIPLQFDQPADIFVEETGEIYVVDGDGGMNNRLLKLSDDYKEIWLTGTNGSGIGQFKIPHSVTVDAFGRVWVADRGNKRIQVFDKVTGEWLGSWNGCFSEDGPYSVRFTADYKYLIVAQLNINRLAILAAPPVGSIGDCAIVHSVQLADETKPHLVDVDMRSGAVYVAEIGAQQVQKYVPLS